MSEKQSKRARKQKQKAVRVTVDVPPPVTEGALKLGRLFLVVVLGTALVVTGWVHGIDHVATLFTAGATGWMAYKIS